MAAPTKAADALALRRTYADICRGYSSANWRGSPLYLKHLTHYDQVDLDVYYEEALAAARARGIRSRAERMLSLDAKGIWTRRDEADLAMQKEYVKNLEKTKSRMFLRNQIDDMRRQLEEASVKLNEMVTKRECLIGLTCERRAEERVQFHYIYLSCYADRALSQPLFTLDALGQLDDDEADLLISFYISIIGKLDMLTIRRASLAPFFTNPFSLCADQVYHFFARPMSELSNYQVNLLSYGLYYRNLLSENKIPDDMRDDPDKLEEFVTKSANFKAAVARTGGEGGRVGMVGMSQDDFDALGITNSTSVMHEAAKAGYTNAVDAAKGVMGVTFV